jgi:hypothetical protein
MARGPRSPENPHDRPRCAAILQAAAISVTARLTKPQFDETVSIFPTMAEELVKLG